MLRKALQDAVDRGYLGCNVADLAHPPTQRAARGHRSRDKAWTVEQLRTFLAASAHSRLAPVWQLASTTGLRRAELCGLRWADVDLERARLRVGPTITEVRGHLVIQNDGKTEAAERSFALDARAVAALRAGVSLEVVSKRLGHSSVVITLTIYAHVSEQDDEAAAELVAGAIYGE